MGTYGKVISVDSQVVVLSIGEKGQAIVCRYGNYMDWVSCPISMLQPI
jgi:hypothetical protein